MHLDDSVPQVDDPVVGNARPRVEAALVVAVHLEARSADLDHERRPRRVFSDIVAKAAPDHGHVRLLRLRLLVQRERPLATHLPAGPERRPKRLFDRPDGREMSARPGLGHDQLATDELDPVAGLEAARLDEALVLDSLPASGLDLHRASSVDLPRESVNVHRRRQSLPCPPRS